MKRFASAEYLTFFWLSLYSIYLWNFLQTMLWKFSSKLENLPMVVGSSTQNFRCHCIHKYLELMKIVSSCLCLDFHHSRNITLFFLEFCVFYVLDLTARLSWINWENLGVHPGRRTMLTSLSFNNDNLHSKNKFNI